MKYASHNGRIEFWFDLHVDQYIHYMYNYAKVINFVHLLKVEPDQVLFLNNSVEFEFNCMLGAIKCTIDIFLFIKYQNA